MDSRNKDSHSLPEPLLKRLSELVQKHLGLDYPASRWKDLERGIKATAKDFQLQSFRDVAEQLVHSPHDTRKFNALAQNLTIGETYFFREKAIFQVLKKQIIPELYNKRKHQKLYLRIWSAGCSTGEEAYSIAIHLRETLPEFKKWEITLLATDINHLSLKKAKSGIYSSWSFRHTPAIIKQKYFRKIDEKRWEIHPKIKAMVTFTPMNLAAPFYPGSHPQFQNMDIIFCRNVLMYFSSRARERMIKNFHETLVNDGWLILSNTESFPELSQWFETIHFPGTFLYRKSPKSNMLTKTDNAPSTLKSVSSAKQDQPTPLPPDPSQQPGNEGIKVVQEEVPEKKKDEHELLQKAQELYNNGQLLAVRTLLEPILRECEKIDCFEFYLLLAQVLADMGQIKKAYHFCNQAISLNRTDYRAHMLLATLLEAQENYHAADKALKKALFLNPQSIMCHIHSGNIAMKLGNPEDAHRHWSNALSLLEQLPEDTRLPEINNTPVRWIKKMVLTMHSQIA